MTESARQRWEYATIPLRSEEHTSELQSRQYLVCRLLLEKKKKTYNIVTPPIKMNDYFLGTLDLFTDHYSCNHHITSLSSLLSYRATSFQQDQALAIPYCK